MTLELRKFHLIEFITGLHDESVLKQYEEMMRKARIEAYEKQLRPLTIAQYQQSVLKAEEQISTGQIIELEDFIKKIENIRWS